MTMAQLEADAARMVRDAPGSRDARWRPAGAPATDTARSAVVRVVIDTGARLGRGFAPRIGAGARAGAGPAHGRASGELGIAAGVFRDAAQAVYDAAPDGPAPRREPKQGDSFTLLDADGAETDTVWRVSGAAMDHDGLWRVEVGR